MPNLGCLRFSPMSRYSVSLSMYSESLRADIAPAYLCTQGWIVIRKTIRCYTPRASQVSVGPIDRSVGPSERSVGPIEGSAGPIER